MLKQLLARLIILVVLATFSYGRRDTITHDLNFNNNFESKKKLEGVDMKGKYLKSDIEQEKDPQSGGKDEPESAKQVPMFIVPAKKLCLGEVMDSSNNLECQGKLVDIQPVKDWYCSSKSQYAQIDNETLCLASKFDKNLKASKDVLTRKFKCEATGLPPVIMKITEYKKFCNKEPWQMTHCYYPKPEKGIKVKLPNPDLPCIKAKCENCYFEDKEVNDKETSLYLI